MAHSEGDEEVARLAITEMIAIEKILFQLNERVETVRIVTNKAQAKLEQENLESLTSVDR